ncbi:MAG: hypothetical protein RLY97_1282 [Pseudomonadota bacterium]|jgi:hypothetical protein
MPKARPETGQTDMVQQAGVGLDTHISQAHNTPPAAKPLDFRKKMSDNIAYALLVYTGLQIFVTMGALKAEGGSLLPYLALIILVVAIIPSCRRFERRWNRLSDAQAADPMLRSYFRHDLIVLWLLAVGLPFAITGVFRLLAMVLT